MKVFLINIFLITYFFGYSQYTKLEPLERKIENKNLSGYRVYYSKINFKNFENLLTKHLKQNSDSKIKFEEEKEFIAYNGFKSEFIENKTNIYSKLEQNSESIKWLLFFEVDNKSYNNSKNIELFCDKIYKEYVFEEYNDSIKLQENKIKDLKNNLESNSNKKNTYISDIKKYEDKILVNNERILSAKTIDESLSKSNTQEQEKLEIDKNELKNFEDLEKKKLNISEDILDEEKDRLKTMNKNLSKFNKDPSSNENMIIGLNKDLSIQKSKVDSLQSIYNSAKGNYKIQLKRLEKKYDIQKDICKKFNKKVKSNTKEDKNSKNENEELQNKIVEAKSFIEDFDNKLKPSIEKSIIEETLVLDKLNLSRDKYKN